MTQTASISPASDVAPAGVAMPGLMLLCFASGCAALIYEIVWLQLLQLVIGSSALSLGVLLGTFMGGMCLGSLALPRAVARWRHPLRVYAFIEIGIGAAGLAVLWGMPYLDRFYAAYGGQGIDGIILRAALCALCLLPPTILMGATLPTIARAVAGDTPRGVGRLGLLYGGNIAGGVFGCLAAGFYLLRVHDMAVATYAAAAVNAVAGITAFVLAARQSYVLPPVMTPGAAHLTSAGAMGCRQAARDSRHSHGQAIASPWHPIEGHPTDSPEPRFGRGAEATSSPGAAGAYVAIALSGLCALGAEVVWTRLLSLLLGPTVYTFSIILAVFLFGLGVGGSAGGLLARRVSRPRAALGWCQLLLAFAVAWTAYAVARSLPYWSAYAKASDSTLAGFGRDLARCLWAVGPPTILWGASFPLALAAAAAASSRGRDPGQVAGGVLAANTLGAIVGSLGFGMLVIPWIGTHGAERLLVGLSALAALAAFGRDHWSSETPDVGPDLERLPRRGLAAFARGAARFGGIAIVAAALIRYVPRVPDLLVAFGPRVPVEPNLGDGLRFLYVGEGVNASVAVTQSGDGARNFHVSGKIEASSEPQDMRLQRMLGHLPALIHPHPRSVLVVGCGAGVTAGSFIPHPEVERIVICEIEPLIPQVVAGHFAYENHHVLSDPRVQVVYDDARHFVLTTHEHFDIITSDPIHPWVKGAAALYSREYFALCRARLNPGGVITQWVPLYESSRDAVRSELATFFDAFPDGTIWGNDVEGEGYDVVLLGQAGPTVIDVDAIQRRLVRRDHADVAASLEEVGFGSVVNLFGTYAGRGPALRGWLAGAQLNADRNLRLQYLAGTGLRHGDDARLIYAEILAHRTFPDDLFVASDPYRQAIRQSMGDDPAGNAPAGER